MLGKKIPTILAILALIAAGIGVWIWQANTSPKVKADIVPTQVKITNVADNKFSVSWTTKSQTKGSIEYGSVGQKLDKTVDDDRGSEHRGLTHHVTIGSLQPNTNYSFRILSGDPAQRFDNSGNVYSVSTGPTLTEVPAARSVYGDITGGSDDTIVYITLPGAAPASVTVKTSGSYSTPISTIRTSDLKSYVSYDPSATVVSLLVDNGLKQSQVTATTTNIAPVPTIALGENADFRSSANSPQVAQVTPTSSDEPSPTPQASSEAQTPQVFNVEPLSDSSINEITDSAYTLQYPAVEGEVISTTRPEFSGTGTGNSSISIAVTGQKTVSDTLRIGASGSWKWSPAIALSLGKQKITITYTDKDDKTQTISRGFSITASTDTSEPAFEATPSASTDDTTSTATASPTPREAMPATDSGVPVTGVIAPTLLTGVLGFAIMVVGAFLLVL